MLHNRKCSRSPLFEGPKGQEDICRCGEEDTEFDWVWDETTKSHTARLLEDKREVRFHQRYSSGTAAVRGEAPMRNDQYYWEIKMTSPVYGTDMMVGVGTADVDLKRYSDTFISLLGSDNQSWGLSYTGSVHHNDEKRRYAPAFGQGNIIGIHLDAWNGTVAFFNNRQSLGIAFSNLGGKTLYPMVSSTAAKSGMKVIRCHSHKTTLQYLSLLALRKAVPSDQPLLQALDFPPGLRHYLDDRLGWLVSSVPRKSVKVQNSFQCSCKRHCCDSEIPVSCKRLCHTV